MIIKLSDFDLLKKELLMKQSIYEIFKVICFQKFTSYCEDQYSKRKNDIKETDQD